MLYEYFDLEKNVPDKKFSLEIPYPFFTVVGRNRYVLLNHIIKKKIKKTYMESKLITSMNDYVFK